MHFLCSQFSRFVAGVARTAAYFGEGDGDIHVSGLKCGGSEASILSCPQVWSECFHDEDAGVICEKGNCHIYLDAPYPILNMHI